jgi:hypothetical protein
MTMRIAFMALFSASWVAAASGSNARQSSFRPATAVNEPHCRHRILDVKDRREPGQSRSGQDQPAPSVTLYTFGPGHTREFMGVELLAWRGAQTEVARRGPDRSCGHNHGPGRSRPCSPAHPADGDRASPPRAAACGELADPPPRSARSTPGTDPAEGPIAPAVTCTDGAHSPPAPAGPAAVTVVSTTPPQSFLATDRTGRGLLPGNGCDSCTSLFEGSARATARSSVAARATNSCLDECSPCAHPGAGCMVDTRCPARAAARGTIPLLSLTITREAKHGYCDGGPHCGRNRRRGRPMPPCCQRPVSDIQFAPSEVELDSSIPKRSLPRGCRWQIRGDTIVIW